MNKINLRRNDLYINILFLSLLSIDSLFRYISEIVYRVPYINVFSSVLTPIILAILFILNIPTIISRIKPKNLLFSTFFLIFLILSLIFNRNSSSYILKDLNYIFLRVLPFYFIAVSINIDEKFFKLIYLGSILILFINILYTYYYLSTGRELSFDSMFESYLMLPYVLFIYWYMFRKKTFLSLLFSIIGTVFVISLGTRGPVLIIFSYISIFVIISIFKKNKFKLTLLTLVVLIVMIFLYIYYFDIILINLAAFIDKLGLSTRVIDSLISDVGQDSVLERTKIYKTLLTLLNEKPFFGYGLFGEYHYIGWSAHNMYLQMVFEFGWIIGIFLIILFIFCGVSIFLRNYGTYYADLILIFYIMVLVQGVFGGNVISYYVFFTIGLLAHKKYPIEKIKLERFHT